MLVAVQMGFVMTTADNFLLQEEVPSFLKGVLPEVHVRKRERERETQTDRQTERERERERERETRAY